jgi:hypothetical protein
MVFGRYDVTPDLILQIEHHHPDGRVWSRELTFYSGAGGFPGHDPDPRRARRRVRLDAEPVERREFAYAEANRTYLRIRRCYAHPATARETRRVVGHDARPPEARSEPPPAPRFRHPYIAIRGERGVIYPQC